MQTMRLGESLNPTEEQSHFSQYLTSFILYIPSNVYKKDKIMQQKNKNKKWCNASNEHKNEHCGYYSLKLSKLAFINILAQNFSGLATYISDILVRPSNKNMQLC